MWDFGIFEELPGFVMTVKLGAIQTDGADPNK